MTNSGHSTYKSPISWHMVGVQQKLAEWMNCRHKKYFIDKIGMVELIQFKNYALSSFSFYEVWILQHSSFLTIFIKCLSTSSYHGYLDGCPWQCTHKVQTLYTLCWIDLRMSPSPKIKQPQMPDDLGSSFCIHLHPLITAMCAQIQYYCIFI